MKNSNSNVIVLILILFLFGITLGIHLSSDIKSTSDNLTLPIYRDMERQEISDLKRANEDLQNRIDELREIIEAYESEMASENITLKKLRNDVTQFQFIAGHRPAEGAGVIITLEGIYSGENIADTVERNLYLVKLINELKYFGAEVISLNDHRLTARGDVIFAGNHINVNGHPIAPPYEIKAIGDQRKISRYVEHGTFIFESMNRNGIRSNIQFLDNVYIPAVGREKSVQFLKPIDES
ncbi:DUF881 domain-containing protein [Alkaliphilus transvaalensis]|uniref:DUF881 domain-containing protein n=1 Tax=Alkaliphilus transvaalensis TaxID=114628 RepID=UPI00047C09E3|nr:DUF881 domain-containing protein [Alkaliphilus transvaalensis]